MSENGPREGTRDLPRRSPEAGQRAVDESSAAGIAYQKLSQSLRRRRKELVALLETGEAPEGLSRSYGTAHPLEPPVAQYEVDAALAEARARPLRRS